MSTAVAAVTAREAEVLALVGRHLTNAEIAAELFVSVRTVESHVAALLRKLQMPDRRALARVAAVGRARPATLPVPVTAFVGRATERAALTKALGEHRLVTAVGPGGIGKSRLAISVAADAAESRTDGAWFVDLVRVTESAAVVAAVAEAVEVSGQSAATPQAALVASLARRDGLLVLDNCEHLLDGVRECVECILSGCPGVTVLATSRTRLLLPYEHVLAVPGMSVRGDRGDAVDLFLARVNEATGERAISAGRVGALCEALDGMALAIELAASRYATLGLDGLEASLHDRLRFLTGGGRAVGRHGSLRNTIGWSYDLLSDEDQALLRGITVFAAWFDVDAAYEVAAPGTSRGAVTDGLARLADHSLLVVERGAPTRYRALETIRQFGEERLEAAGELAVFQARHREWCRATVTQLAAAEPDDAWCDRFDRVIDDARAALLRLARDPDRRDLAAAFAAQLAGQLWLRGRLTEAQRRYEQAAALDPVTANQAVLLRKAAGAAGTGFAGVDMLRLLREAADVALSLGDRRSASRDLAVVSLTIARSPGIMSEAHTADEAASMLDEATAISDGSAAAEAAIVVAQAFFDYRDLTIEGAERAVAMTHDAGDAAMESAALDLLTAVQLRFNDLPAAVAAVQRRETVIESLAVEADNGFEHSDHALYASEVLLAAGDLAGAADYASRLARLPFNRTEHYLGLARVLKVDALAGHFDNVLRDAERFRTSWERSGRPVVPNLGSSAYAVAMVHGILGDDGGRAEWAQVTEALFGGQPGITGLAWRSTFDALVALHRGDVDGARLCLAADIDDDDTWWHAGLTMYRPWYAAVWAEAAVLARCDDATDRIDRARRATRHNPIASAIVERAAALATRDRRRVERFASSFAALGCVYQRDRTGVLASFVR